MIFTDDYSRVAAVFTMSVDEAFRVLGISGTGSLDEDKKLVRRVIMENHPDKNPSKEAMQKMQAANVLLETFIRKGMTLPTRGGTQQETPRYQYSPAQEEREEELVLDEREMLNMIARGYNLVDHISRMSTSWISENKDCTSILDDLSRGLYRDCKRLGAIMGNNRNRLAYPRFISFMYRYSSWWRNISELDWICRNNNGEVSNISTFYRNMEFNNKEVLKDQDRFMDYYSDWLFNNSRNR